MSHRMLLRVRMKRYSREMKSAEGPGPGQLGRKLISLTIKILQLMRDEAKISRDEAKTI